MPVPHRRVALSALALLTAAAVLAPGAVASIFQPDVVSEDPVDHTPHLVEEDGSRPFALAVAKLGDTMYVGGQFGAVENASRTAASRLQVDNIVAFDAQTGALDRDFTPRLDGNVFAIRAVGDSVYVGGSFENVNGEPRPSLAKLDAETGALDTTFRPGATNSGRVSEIRLVDGRLVVGGTFRHKLLALGPETGRNTGYIDLPVTGQVPLSSTKTEVYRFAVNPARDRLVAVGNFTAVDGKDRRRVFMLNLGPDAASVSDWYYQPLHDKCRTDNPIKQHYIEDVDFSPSGGYFVLVSTGFLTEEEDGSQIGTHVCDAAARFETNVLHPTKPTWINYTGGDTLHAVAATGSAVYVQGHNRWLDNPEGEGNNKGPGAVDRLGIGAINPVTGKALPWNPGKPARQGGQDFLATQDGLWVPSDSKRFNGEYHRGIAFVPLP